MATPPTIRDLMDDPVYRSYMRTPPVTIGNPSLTFGQPWQIWVQTRDDRWKTGRFSTYPQAFNMMARAVKAPNASDVALVSRRVFFPPPGVWEQYKVKVRRRDGSVVIETRERWVQTFIFDDIRFEWCPRCRRPTEFRWLHWTHHALRQQPCLTEDDPHRCMYCGIRRVAVPDINALVRMAS